MSDSLRGGTYRAALATVILAALASQAAAAPSGRVTSGWPKPGPGERTSLQTLERGPVVIIPGSGAGRSLIAAWRADGSRRWVRTADLAGGCGNCPSAFPNNSLADGPFGPIGFIAPRFVGATGAFLPSGPLAILRNGTQIFVEDATPRPGSVTRAVRDGHELWQRSDPFLADFFEGATNVLTNGTTVIRGFADPNTPTIALDPVDGHELWRVPNRFPEAPFGSGAVVRSLSGDLDVINGDGTVAFSVPSDPRANSRYTIGDVRQRSRLYINALVRNASGSGYAWQAQAYDTTTGARAWTIPDARALSVTRAGLLLAAVTVRGRNTLRAYRPDGSLVWSHETTTAVDNAISLTDGTVALVTRGAGDAFWTDQGLLVRINPQVGPLRVRRMSIALSTSRFRRGCREHQSLTCTVSTALGTTIRIDSPRRRTWSVRLTTRGDTTTKGGWVKLTVPAGRSYTRFATLARTGARLIQFRNDSNGRIFATRSVTVLP